MIWECPRDLGNPNKKLGCVQWNSDAERPEFLKRSAATFAFLFEIPVGLLYVCISIQHNAKHWFSIGFVNKPIQINQYYADSAHHFGCVSEIESQQANAFPWESV
jgi:hypothetical protein